MPDILPAYRVVLDELRPVLHDLPGKLIGIDGRNGVGKTTLGRFLAWQSNISLIETDLFLHRHTGRLEYRVDEIGHLIQARLEKPRPVIVDGITLFSILGQMNQTADFVIYCRSTNDSEGNYLEPILENYEAQYAPIRNANLVVDLDWTDS
ncbi:MAG: hypothetical protein FKY71_07735 [Spiribacter salinus]|uniref:AAA family ATPase n=1 Tax=Spiribacter salinus TaxID=1335746 RepID=A0A540VS57_9GAMM|nr:MAG: hypothetical protein FKY71_07735 [Spiribacter salinus]